MHAKLERLAESRRISDLHPAWAGSDASKRETGFIVEVSNGGDAWVLLQEVTGEARLDGYRAFPVAEIKRAISVRTTQHFYAAAATKLGWRPRRPRGVSLASVPELLETATARFPLILLERSRKRPGACWIGRIETIEATRVCLRTIDVRARLAEAQWFHYADLTCIAFGGSYLRALAAVLQHDA